MITQKTAALQARLIETFKASSISIQIAFNQITLTCAPADWRALAQRLRDDAELAFEQCMDLCGVDYSTYANRPCEGRRYAVVIHLLSLTHNWRLRVKTFLDDDENPVLDSLVPVWNGLNWFEREAFDLLGITFTDHPDLRRILTDYAFEGHPLRKDFPIMGQVEMHYDPDTRQVQYQPANIDPQEITPRIVREEPYGE